MQVLSGADRFGAQAGGPPHWIEHLSVPDLSVGTYSLPAGSADTQDPHSEDEIYVVLRGRGALATEDATADVGPGSVVYRARGRDCIISCGIVEDLTVLVLFAPAEGARASSTGM